MKAVELFTGMGGLALGLERAGFEHLALVEWDRDAHQTARENHPGWPLGPEPIDVTLYAYDSIPEGIDLLAGGPPCQPFSLGGKHHGQHDHRNMFPEMVRAQRALRPKAILVENVYGLNRPAFRPYLDYILLQLRYPFVLARPGEDWEHHKARLERVGQRQPRAETYEVGAPLLINAADYGAPQIRRRILIVGFRRDLGVTWTPPEPTHSRDVLGRAQDVKGSYWQEHGLPDRGGDGINALRVPDGRLRWNTVRDALGHTMRNAMGQVVYENELPPPVDGQEHPVFRNHVGVPGARVYAGHTGNALDRPAKAVKAGDHGCPGGEHVLIRDDGTIRYFTVREVARLQGFPDSVHFTCSRTEAMRQIGNAVPVPVAEAFGMAVKHTLESAGGKRASRTARRKPRAGWEKPAAQEAALA